MHEQAYAYVEHVIAGLPFTPRRVVEIGGRQINGTVRPLFHRAVRYVAVDLADGPGVDVVSDGAIWQPDFTPDCVVSTECLEHTPVAAAIIANAYEMLAPGGVLILTCAGEGRAPHSGIDGLTVRPHEHYANVHEADLRRWLASFASVQIEVDHEACDLRATATKG